ncbi:BMP family ABC transporter substrate-binding protein [Schinkia azotoformans]|uniref:Transcriptional activator protein Med n=1 Tax=Schinkia azotoformans LMG 9581 TaxID=1131731 RepID=K6DRG7_SCHAZ|nr:BMP family ABC transporter substrate-binding protein [Schinkia azotoformans]EKN63376.1 transcriptional activator protein Med [Schinkia azotoformans LMG 9581]MEC1638675.1 BMP family ABC transporter substrate-binding protein [Schinkia azotoformans]MEC1719266.1 BMP family ABC transporter substrate-binding protein [Schinkia azotoformans]MEC1946640.1 BMP family ABC transporter substrate-binding protein [Schinkia azotoformans]MED4353335.1 BMP family ABC transporter substrate-binding protein [Schi
MKKLLLILATFILLVTACGQPATNLSTTKIGLLLPDTINEPIWGNKGYKGLLLIQSALKADVYYKESMKTRMEVKEALDEFEEEGVNLVFGHGGEYGPFFEELHNDYPDMDFVYFNGNFTAENVTSIKFESHAMGFFGGMVAAEMSKTKHIGVISAFNWQPEVEGFVKGAEYQDPNVVVDVHYTKSWSNKEKALKAYSEMEKTGVDVFYPAGDSFNLPVIEAVKEDGHYAIGYVSDQLDLGESTVLTSTVQHVEGLYKLIATQYIAGKFQHGIKTFDFGDDVISLGDFSPEVPDELKVEVNKAVELYKLTGEFPGRK